MTDISCIKDLFDKVLAGETVLTREKEIYDELCSWLAAEDIDFVSGDIDPKYPNEPYYVELNG